MTSSIPKRNYLNNKSILEEIHKSKKSFCYFTKSEYSDWDIILSSVDDIPDNLDLAKEARAKRLTVAAQDESLKNGIKLSKAAVDIKAEDIKVTDIIFRITSWDHIPEAPIIPKNSKDKKSKSVVFDDEVEEIVHTEYDEEVVIDNPIAVKYVKLNFPPFLHYRILPSGELEVVGKSHWKGDLETGSFCRDHGKVTNKLAMMYVKLCEKYATRSNWRGYSYNDEMISQGLLQLSIVGLQFDESKSLNPFAYYTSAITNSFTRVLNSEKKSRDIRDDLMQEASLNPSYTRQNSEHADFGSDDY